MQNDPANQKNRNNPNDSGDANDGFNIPSNIYPNIPKNPFTDSTNRDIPRNPLGLPEDYPPFGPHIRIDRVYPPDIGYEHHHHHHHPRHPDVPDMGNYPNSLMGPEHPYFHKHEHPSSPFPPPPEGKKEGQLYTEEDANTDSLGRGDMGGPNSA